MSLNAHLYLVTDAISDDTLEAALRGGVDLVQLRMKTAEDSAILEAAARFKALCDAYDVPLIINDRADLSVAAGAAGVHLGQDDQSAGEARLTVGDAAIVGLSTHDSAQVDAAQDLPLDYFAVGPVHLTPTKPGRPAVGESLVRYAAEHAKLPFFAIGGLDGTNVRAVVLAGGRRIAVVRAITEASDPQAAAQALAQALESTGEPA